MINQIEDLLPDDHNPNKHSERGGYALRKSIEKFGFREAGTLDRNNKIVGGNHRTEVAAELELDDIVIIDADPSKPIYIRYRDLDLDDPENPARELSIALNRTAELSIDWDEEELAKMLVDGLDVSDWFHDNELVDMFEELVDDIESKPYTPLDIQYGDVIKFPSRHGQPHSMIIYDQSAPASIPDLVITKGYDYGIDEVFSIENNPGYSWLWVWDVMDKDQGFYLVWSKQGHNRRIIRSKDIADLIQAILEVVKPPQFWCEDMLEGVIAGERIGSVCICSTLDIDEAQQVMKRYYTEFGVYPEILARD